MFVMSYIALTSFLVAFLLGWMKPLGIKMAEKYDATVILVDWQKLSYCNYFKEIPQIVASMGEYLAEKIKSLDHNRISTIEIVGHSLGTFSA